MNEIRPGMGGELELSIWEPWVAGPHPLGEGSSLFLSPYSGGYGAPVRKALADPVGQACHVRSDRLSSSSLRGCLSFRQRIGPHGCSLAQAKAASAVGNSPPPVVPT